MITNPPTPINRRAVIVMTDNADLYLHLPEFLTYIFIFLVCTLFRIFINKIKLFITCSCYFDLLNVFLIMFVAGKNAKAFGGSPSESKYKRFSRTLSCQSNDPTSSSLVKRTIRYLSSWYKISRNRGNYGEFCATDFYGF